MQTAESEQNASFAQMINGTASDYAKIKAAGARNFAGLADRLVDHLTMLGEGTGGFAVTRLEHSLQSATRAFRDGRDEEYVVCALLHDIGDVLGSANHAELGAMMLKPFISAQNYWMIEKHGIFQGYYFWHHLGGDRNSRERFRGHEWFEYTAQFCHLYDQNSFEIGYDTMPLEAFVPMVRRLIEKRASVRASNPTASKGEVVDARKLQSDQTARL